MVRIPYNSAIISLAIGSMGLENARDAGHYIHTVIIRGGIGDYYVECRMYIPITFAELHSKYRPNSHMWLAIDNSYSFKGDASTFTGCYRQNYLKYIDTMKAKLNNKFRIFIGQKSAQKNEILPPK